MKIDKNAAFANRPTEFEIQEFYAMVEYYIVYKYKSETEPRLVAFVQWTNQVVEDNMGLKTFKGFGIKQYIDVCVIDRCVGFLEVDNINYVIDKEVNDPDDSDLYLTEEDEI